MRQFRPSALIVLLLSFNYCHGGGLDFEDAASFGGDDALISPDYFASKGFSISVIAGSSEKKATEVPFAFESIGMDGTDVFQSRHTSTKDTALSGELGNYFLKAGTNDFAYKNAKYFKLSIDYSSLSTAASGEIWDIDGPEQYQVVAYDSNGNTLTTLESPRGGLDGEPWRFSVDIDPKTGKTIDRIEIESIGQGNIRGFAFDNFDGFSTAASSVSPVTHATPLPTSLPLIVAGMTAFMVHRRTRAVSRTETHEG